MANDYDLANAFERIENELIDSMMRNMVRHKAEETAEGIQWSMWQAEQLKALEKYRRDNQSRYSRKFAGLNRQIEDLIRQSRQMGGTKQEIRILQAIRKGFKGNGRNHTAAHQMMTAEFFRLNERKLDALIEATMHDMQKAETAVLRMANDRYRKIIYNAQVYANTGAGTYEKAVDMATKDFLSAGLNCIEYANGARHRISDYAEMAIRTASKRAYLQGEGEKRQEWGISTVIINKRRGACPLCAPFVGKVMIDDVWSGGKQSDGKYPLLSSAIAAGLYHPNCKDSHTTYFPGISTAEDTWTKEELQKVGADYLIEQKQANAKRQAERFGRLAEYSLDPENKRIYEARRWMWKNVYFKTGNQTTEEYAKLQRFRESFNAVKTEQVVEVLRKDSEVWIDRLTDFEKIAIQKYTFNPGDKKPGRLFERINAMLRGDMPIDVKLQKYADSISSAVKKFELKSNVICHRGSNVDMSNSAQVGQEFVVPQFTSASAISSKALSGKYHFVIYTRAGSRAAYIEKLSDFPAQREVLFDKNSVFRVLSRQGKTVILEVLQ